MFTSRILPIAIVFTNLVVLTACATTPSAGPEPAPTEALVVEETEPAFLAMCLSMINRLVEKACIKIETMKENERVKQALSKCL